MVDDILDGIYYKLLFEMQRANIQSKKIRNGLELYVEKLVSPIEKLLDDERENGTTKFNSEERKEKASTLLAPH